ncbi:Clavaminate synthase-like protein [Hyaloscypha variabilis F]|uniref:Clavaminate synthase-like protein n=1 Tax=Hyaloscypha variabilis (strain UAMH 11265 / GT02V1 / F) TaxID=1149755 RepID=A0A2J6S6I1_HYAVF|nr:Clavaminate synthase-like protein [Hyaloscypha variabilis F]
MPSTTQELTSLVLANTVYSKIQESKKERFIYVINFGLSQDEIDEQYDIAQELFESPLDEKEKLRAELEKGDYFGYKPFGLREVKPGVPENTEVYNIPSNWAAIEKFSAHIRDQIVAKLFKLFAIVLELPDDYFLDFHRKDELNSSYMRYMKYHARTPEQNAALENIWLKGHTDFGSLTLLFRQSIAALQVRTPSGEWKYVKPYPESLTVDVADKLQFLSNGFLKSSIHRVVAPPSDQAHLDGLGVLYFSAVLKREGLLASEDETVELIAKDWISRRVIANISSKEIEVEKEDLNKVGDGLMPVYT